MTALWLGTQRRFHAAAGRLHPVLWPVLAAGLAAAVCGYVAEVDPGVSGHYPTCPFLAVTGYYCPGCGTLRAIHALTHGHLGQAFGYNALSMTMVPVLAYWWVTWVIRAVRGQPRPEPKHPRLIWGLAAVIMVFWVVRNLPFGSFLAPTGRFF